MMRNLSESWKKVLAESLNTDSFNELTQFIESEYHKFPTETFPKKEQIFRAFAACSFDKLKVVILGQDPYPTAGHAHGLCFSCDSSVRPLPKSLGNIFKEFEADLGKKAPEHGDLNAWSEQGVLLLNSILTVRQGNPLSHANKGWEQFTDSVIEKINTEKENIVFVLWGNPAIAKASKVDREKHYVLSAPHPSPLSAYRGFFGSKPFSNINRILSENGQKPIEW